MYAKYFKKNISTAKLSNKTLLYIEYLKICDCSIDQIITTDRARTLEDVVVFIYYFFI